MPVPDVYQFKGHISSPLRSVFVAASGAETDFTAERDKFELPTFWAAVHGAAKRRVTAGIILSKFSISVLGGWRVYLISS